MRRRLALIDESFSQRARKLPGRPLGIVAVIAFVFPGQQHVQHVVRIVIPLSVEIAPQVFGDIAVVLEHQMHMAAGLDRCTDLRRHLVEPAGLGDGVHGIQAQPVEAIFHQPIERVLDEEATHLGAAKIDCRTPRRFHVVAEGLRRVAGKIISVRPEVIVDDVEKDHQPVRMRRIDQGLEVVGRTIGMVRREGQNAVISPVSFAGKIIDRHQFDRRDAELLQLRQFDLHTGKAAEQTCMKFIKDRFAPRPSVPFRVTPAIGARIDHDARAVDVLGLRARCGVGHHEIGTEPITIARACAACDLGLEPPARVPLHRPGLRRRVLAGLDLDRHALACRSPQAKARPVLAEKRCAEWKIAQERRHDTAVL